MISLGVLLVILGVGSLVLPYLNLQFSLMELVDPYQPWAGIIVAAIGLITVLFGAQRRGRKEVVVEPAAAAPAAAATTYAATTPAGSPPAQPAASEPSGAGAAAQPPSAAPGPTPSERAWPTEPPERSDD
jgi:predicted lipid-binding transport protein (Tim44 family)